MPSNYPEIYFPVLIQVLIAAGLASALILISTVLGKRARSPLKDTPYESGMAPVGSARERFSVKFYLVAMVFLLFDIEAIFLVPWAISYNGLIKHYGKWFPYFEMMLFIALFLVGYIYVLRKGVLEWGKSKSD